MAVQVSYPGVYIDELTLGRPIQGVGTATAAFVGAAAPGSPVEPTKLTRWERFTELFGDLPVPNTYLWYAVRGFFQNGGQVCYVARVSTETSDHLTLLDRATAPRATVVLQARQPGPLNPRIRVRVVDSQIVTEANGRLYRPTASITSVTGSAITVSSADEARQFRSGDVVTWDTRNEPGPSVVLRVDDSVIRLQQSLVRNYQPSAGTTLTLRLADPMAGTTILRARGVPGLSAGSAIGLRPTPPPPGPQPSPEFYVVRSMTPERISPTLTTYRLQLREGLRSDLSLADPVTVQSYEFRLSVTRAATLTRPAYSTVYDELGMDPEHRNYFARVINDDPDGLLHAAPDDAPNTTAPPDDRPGPMAAPADLAGGTVDNPAAHTPVEYRHAIASLEAIDDVNILVVPGGTGEQVQLAMLSHCTQLKDRFAVLDPVRGAPMFGANSVEAQRTRVETVKGHAALYYPWLSVPGATGTLPVLVPPSGHVAGVIARTDGSQGVHKAPAGMEALLEEVIGVERTMSDADQGLLNLAGVNVIRVFAPGGRPRVWGARTTASETDWRYVNVRRLFLYLEESIEEGIRWAVFQPNGPDLWQQLRRTIGDFLTRVWRDGALFGERPEDAFQVRCDEGLNPFADQQLGLLTVEVRVRVAYPAEFIVVRIGISPGETQIQE